FGHVHHTDDGMDAGDVGVLHFAVVGSFQWEIGGSTDDAEVDLAVGADGDGAAFIGRSATQVRGIRQGSVVAIQLGEAGVLVAKARLGVGVVGKGEVGGLGGPDEVDE